MTEKLKQLLDTLLEWATHTGVRVLLALLILFVSFKLINWLGRRITKAGKKKQVDKTILNTLVYALKLLLKCVVAVCMVSFVGIDTSGITALIASVGVCAGLAVNGALSNLAGGVLILVTRPFKVDDFIEAQGVSGTVTDIHIITTKIRTPDNKVIYLPNGVLSADTIINYSEMDRRRVELVFSIAYSADFEKAKTIVRELAEAHEMVLKDEPIFVRMSEHAASSLQIKTRVWTKTEDYWTVYFDLTESVKRAFDENGIEIPFNQLDVHVKNDGTTV